MKTKSHLPLGIFFIVSLSILAAYTLMGTDTAALFGDPILLRVNFPDAYGLRKGDPVQLVGSRIGRVRSVTIDTSAAKDRRVLVVLSLDMEVELKHGALVTISDSTLLGGHQINIDPGEPGGLPLATEGGVVLGEVLGSPIASLSSVGDLVADNREAVSSILENLEAVMADVRAGKGLVGRILVDEAMAEDLTETLASIREATDKIEAGEGLLGALINDAEMTQSVRNTFDSIEAIAAELETGKGLAGRLINDEAMGARVQETLDYFASIGERIDSGEGILGRLISDDVLAEELTDIVDNIATVSADIEAVVAKVRTGEGNLGKFLMEDELYDEVLGAVRLLTRSLEDFREAAPVTAFTSVLFSAF